MNVKNRIFPVLLLGLLLGACNREVSIVEFNESYKIDESYVSVEIPAKLNHNPNNIILFAGATEVLLSFRYDETTNTVAMPNRRIPIKVKLKKPLSEAMNVVFTEDKSLLQSYTGEQLGYKDFPEGVFSDAKMSIPKGEREVVGEIELKNVEALRESPGYLTGLKMTLEKESDNVVVSKINYALYVKANKSDLRDEENVERVTALPSGLTQIDRAKIKPVSTFATEHLYKLVDGSTWTNWWITPGSDVDLVLNFPKTKVGVLLLKTTNTWDPKSLKSVKVSISEDGGTFYKQGEIAISDHNVKIVYIKFIKPQEISSIRLSEFEGHNTEAIDIYEAEIFAVTE